PIVESYHPNRAGNVGYADVFWPGAAATASGSDLTSAGSDLTSAGSDRTPAGGTGATSSTESAGATATDIVADDQHAHEVREQADAVLAMDLTSRANLAAARAEGVNTGELVRLVGQLRSGSTQVVEQALADLARMDRAHEARQAHEEPGSRQAGS